MKRHRLPAPPRTWAAAGLSLVLVLLAAAAPAGATTLRRMDLPELVGRAHRVVRARAVDRQVYWNAEGTRIYTDTTFEVLDEAKGHGPGRLTVSLLGGRIDPAVMIVDGTPEFHVGEEVVLFTSPRPDGKQNLVGFSQGVMRVREDPATGAKFVAGEVPVGVRFVETRGGAPVAVPGESLRAPLDAFMKEVRAIASGAKGAGGGIEMTPQRPTTLEQGGSPR
ncbi:MAG TPA: hypothetical protein VNI57_11675 [Candidatus Saccharimonadales bacterium]|nr:hypothetical protein [Candidatus Saccharimonadales bacterium]